jgi:hypothetical protein
LPAFEELVPDLVAVRLAEERREGRVLDLGPDPVVILRHQPESHLPDVGGDERDAREHRDMRGDVLDRQFLILLPRAREWLADERPPAAIRAGKMLGLLRQRLRARDRQAEDLHLFGDQIATSIRAAPRL